MKKNIKTKIIFIVGISILISVLGFGNIVRAQPDDLVVEFEQEPLFSETNLGPGESVTRWIKITNNSDSAQRIAIKADNIQECSGTDCLSDILEILIKEGTVELYKKSLTQFYSEGEVFLSNLDSGSSTQYDIVVNFSEISGDAYQDKTTGFDLIIGFQLTGRVAGATTGPSGETIPQKIGKVLGAATGSPVFLTIFISLAFSLTIYFIVFKLKKIGRKT